LVEENKTTAKTKADPCGMTTKGQATARATARATAKTKAVDEELKEKKRGGIPLFFSLATRTRQMDGLARTGCRR
jgi:hypothetical protein